MPRKVLIGYDGSEQSMRALDYAISLLKQTEATSTEFHLAYVVEKPPNLADPVPEEVLESLKKVGNDVLSNGVRVVKKLWETPITHLEFGSPPEKLLKLADILKVDLVVLGIAKHPASERILGTVSSFFFNARRYPILGVP
jgi:nucleotide-binding universal stress UspA family protein